MDDSGSPDGLTLMGRALASHDPLELAVAKNNKDRHASHRVASFLAGMTG